MSENNAATTSHGIDGLDVEVMKVPVLSTAHLSGETDQMLRTGTPEFFWHCAKYEFGYFISIPTEEFESGLDPKLPADMAAIFAWARKHGFGWVRLDSDGSQVEGLELFEWSQFVN